MMLNISKMAAELGMTDDELLIELKIMQPSDAFAILKNKIAKAALYSTRRWWLLSMLAHFYIEKGQE